MVEATWYYDDSENSEICKIERKVLAQIDKEGISLTIALNGLGHSVCVPREQALQLAKEIIGVML